MKAHIRVVILSDRALCTTCDAINLNVARYF